MTDIPDGMFEPDDPRGWPVAATVLVRLDPRDMSNVRITSEGMIPKGLLVSVMLGTFSDWMDECNFADGMFWHTGGDHLHAGDREERHDG